MKPTFAWIKNCEDPRNTTVLFWMEFTCDQATQIELSLSAIDVYKLYVNEKFVSCGPARAAKGYTRLDRVSCALVEGVNRIAVVVTSYGVCTYSNVKQQPFFLCDFTVGGISYTAKDFTAYLYDARVKHVQRYSTQRAFVEFYRQTADLAQMLRTPATFFEVQSSIPIPAPQIIDRVVPHPCTQLITADKPIGRGVAVFHSEKTIPTSRYIDVEERSYDAFEMYPRAELTECTIDYVTRLDFSPRSTVNAALSDGEYAVYDLGRNLAGFFGLDVCVSADAELYYVYDECLQADGTLNCLRNDTCNVIKWELTPGRYSLESMDIYGSRYVQIILRKGTAKIDHVSVRSVENPDAYNLKFHCDDADVLKVIGAAQNTLAQCALDLFMDCPSRERSGWINDVFFTRRAAEVLMGNNRVERATLENFAMCGQDVHIPARMIPMCYPADHPSGRYIPNCAMWYGIIACEYCIKTGDGAFAAYIKNRLYDVLRFFERYENEHELLEDLESWVFVEWSEANSTEFLRGVNFPSNMMYVAMLEAIAKLYGDEKIAEKAKRMRKSIEGLSFNGDFFEDNRIRDAVGDLQLVSHVSEACQYHAFYFGYASQASHPALYKLLEMVFTPERDKTTVYPRIDKANIITGLMMREFIWLKNGERARAIEETKRIFLPMAKATDTLWEHTGDYASCNHGCAAYAAYVLVRAYTGFYGLRDGLPVFDEKYLGKNCDMRLALEKGTLYLSVKNGVREWRVE